MIDRRLGSSLPRPGYTDLGTRTSTSRHEGWNMPTICPKPQVRLTERLRLEPIRGEHAEDYFRVFDDDAIAPWYAGKLTRDEATREAERAERTWRVFGFHKWLIYERASGEVIGRGGLSAMRVNESDGAIRAFLPKAPWVEERFGNDDTPNPLARRWAEIGWALRGPFWGRGYAAEVGRAGLRCAFEDLDMQAVVAFTERHNTRSRAVMHRIGMNDAGEYLGNGMIDGLAGVHDGAPFALAIALRADWTPNS